MRIEFIHKQVTSIDAQSKRNYKPVSWQLLHLKLQGLHLLWPVHLLVGGSPFPCPFALLTWLPRGQLSFSVTR